MFTPDERQRALESLFRFSRRAEFKEAHRVAVAAFWADWMDRHTDPEVRQAMELEQSGLGLLEWFVFDFHLPSGRTVTEEFLQRDRRGLRSGEARYLERMRLAHLRLYEVAQVRPDEGLDLVDLWTKERLRVQERLATRQLVQWDLIGARVMLGPAAVPVLDGVVYLYPAMAREAILKRLRRAHRDFRGLTARGDLVTFLKVHGMLFHHLWLDHVALRPLPTLLTAEGDTMVLARVTFDIKDREALDAAVSGHPQLEGQDDGRHLWLEEVDDVRRGLGTIALEGSRLLLETTSRPRAERGRALIETLAGSAVKYRATTYRDVGRALRDQPAPADKPSGVPPEVEAVLVGQFFERHYRKWPDEALPALGGRTPREAAQLKSARPKVVALLKAMENGAERQRREGRPAYDFAWMWKELGL